MSRTALVTGATGFIGSRLLSTLTEQGWDVRGLVRNPDSDRARALERRGVGLHHGDVLDADSLSGAGRNVEVAYYLVHSMGRGSRGDFAARELRAARGFAEMARAEGVGHVVFLGGLGENPTSTHLRSRHASAEALREHGPPLTYLRASMVVGAGSESYRTLRYLVQRLPAMIAPAWLKNETQPIGVDDTLAFLAASANAQFADSEIEIGGPDVLSYGEMLDRMAAVLGLPRRPRIPVPFVTPWLSSLWIGLVTPVDAGVARPLVEGLASPTVVTDPSGMARFDVEPIGFDEALRRAVAEDPEVPQTARGGRNTSPNAA